MKGIGKKLELYLSSWLHASGYRNIYTRLDWEDAKGFEISFYKQEIKEHTEEIGSSTFYKKNTQSLHDQYLEIVIDWNEDCGAFTLPLLTEARFNEILGITSDNLLLLI